MFPQQDPCEKKKNLAKGAHRVYARHSPSVGEGVKMQTWSMAVVYVSFGGSSESRSFI
jgi:hypothetical protein